VRLFGLVLGFLLSFALVSLRVSEREVYEEIVRARNGAGRT
jgi:hypothetical protein